MNCTLLLFNVFIDKYNTENEKTIENNIFVNLFARLVVNFTSAS